MAEATHDDCSLLEKPSVEIDPLAVNDVPSDKAANGDGDSQIIATCCLSKRGKQVWVFSKCAAPAYARAIEHDCVKNRGVKRTVDKIVEAGIIPNDQSEGTKLLRYYMNLARETNNPVHLLKAYTLESSFYRHINDYMSEGDDNEVFKKLCGGWSGYYTGALMRHPALSSYRWRGSVFRGFVIDKEDFDKSYKMNYLISNKAFQSTSKLAAVARRFAYHRESINIGDIRVMISYNILDNRAALDIENISRYPAEKEVLMMPGCLFKISSLVLGKSKNDLTVVTVDQLLTMNA
ncbi:unnamed protein product [Adineta ricciae]|uniref:ADP ribosyltransferase domain-containing protein n=1 Tax=Adineta ricciae TaxID=249248 RepID=A0A814LY99_ADIRI|nr:unnamed protein product [Adineta ricciae]CAF1124558.1 unnamed protein product [Adineta ricciae]